MFSQPDPVSPDLDSEPRVSERDAISRRLAVASST